MIYITHYEKYPIYEAAEGGYYYEGAQPIEYAKGSNRTVKKWFQELFRDLKKEENPADPWYMSTDGKKIFRNGQYIGEGEFYIIEKVCGANETGYKPYC